MVGYGPSRTVDWSNALFHIYGDMITYVDSRTITSLQRSDLGNCIQLGWIMVNGREADRWNTNFLDLKNSITNCNRTNPTNLLSIRIWRSWLENFFVIDSQEESFKDRYRLKKTEYCFLVNYRMYTLYCFLLEATKYNSINVGMYCKAYCRKAPEQNNHLGIYKWTNQHDSTERESEQQLVEPNPRQCNYA